jgi:hypothetical protein
MMHQVMQSNGNKPGKESATAITLRTVLRMLDGALGKTTRTDPKIHQDLDQLAGTWSEKEAAAFEAALVEQRRIDPELWK